jgi:hypothetical protein
MAPPSRPVSAASTIARVLTAWPPFPPPRWPASPDWPVGVEEKEREKLKKEKNERGRQLSAERELNNRVLFSNSLILPLLSEMKLN